MRHTATLLLVLLAILTGPARSFGAIQEVADDNGNVTHYKYTDKNGSVVFTDALAKIPDEYRKSNKLVRVGPPKKKEAPVEKSPAVGVPPPEVSAPPLFQVQPDATPVQEESSGSYLWLIIVLATIGAGVAGFTVYRRVNDDRPAPPRKRGAPPLPRDRAPVRSTDPAPEHPRPPDPREQRSEPERNPAPEAPEEVLNRYLQARDYVSAARHCASRGDLAQAAAIYVKAGLFSEAAAISEAEQDFLRAAEAYLKAGNSEKAAECFEKGGDLMQAATMFQEVGDFARAGDLFFQAGFFMEAAENFSLVSDLARAGEAYERAGSFLQAAQAFETVGIDRERLATLYEKGEDFYPAGRLFVKLGQLDRALNILQQVDAASSNYASASLLVGMIFLKRGLTDLAREKFLKIIDNQPVGKSNLEPYYFLALCHERAGNAEAANSIFAKILAEDYGFRDVNKRIAG